MTKLERAKETIAAYFSCGDCGLYDNRNWCGDPMTNLVDTDGLIVDICYEWSYFEVFGLNNKEWNELVKFYDDLQKESKG